MLVIFIGESFGLGTLFCEYKLISFLKLYMKRWCKCTMIFWIELHLKKLNM